MTQPSDGSTRITPPTDSPVTGTRTGSDVTGHMTGTSAAAGVRAEPEHLHTPHAPHAPHAGTTTRPGTGTGTTRYKTSAAAVFALVFGLAALFCALTGILAPAAVVFGLLGVVLGVADLKMAKRAGVTGKGVAIGGLVTAVLGLLLGAGVLAGLAVAVNSDSNLNRISEFVDSARGSLPSGQELESGVEGAVR